VFQLVVEVVPLPVAVFLRRRPQGVPREAVVVGLQGTGRRGDVRPVAFPAFRGGGLFRLRPRRLRLRGQFPEGDRRKAGNDGNGEQEQGDDRQGGGNRFVMTRPAGKPFHRGNPPRLDRLVAEEALQVGGQLAGGLVAAARFPVDRLVDDGLQVAGHVGV